MQVCTQVIGRVCHCLGQWNVCILLFHSWHEMGVFSGETWYWDVFRRFFLHWEFIFYHLSMEQLCANKWSFFAPSFVETHEHEFCFYSIYIHSKCIVYQKEAVYLYKSKLSDVIFVFFFVQVRLRTEVLRTPSSIRARFELMTSRSWQYIPCHWDACSNHLAISDSVSYKHLIYIYIDTQDKNVLQGRNDIV